MENFFKQRLCLDPIAGANISACVREAISVAFQEHVTVVFVFNGKTFKADPLEIANFVLDSADK